ncbi:MAG TPA: phage portal protein, partial [Candidatus Paceibacterota bacterium]
MKKAPAKSSSRAKKAVTARTKAIVKERISITPRKLNQMITRAVDTALKAQSTKYPDILMGGSYDELANIPDRGIFKNQMELYRRLSWVATAVELTAQTAATTVLNVKRKSGEKTEDVPNHEFELLLNHPNEMDSRLDFLLATFAFRKLAGNAYWWLNKPSEFAPPLELWILPPHRVRPVPDEKLYLRGYMYDPGDGKEIALEPWEIVHFRRYNPFS